MIAAERAGCSITLDQVDHVKVYQAQLEISVSFSNQRKGLKVIAPYTMRRRGVESRIVLNSATKRPADLTLINGILRSMEWVDLIKQGQTISEIAARHNVTPAYITHTIDLAYLSPKIMTAISRGMQRPDVSASQLSKVRIPVQWANQDVMFLG